MKYIKELKRLIEEQISSPNNSTGKLETAISNSNFVLKQIKESLPSVEFNGKKISFNQAISELKELPVESQKEILSAMDTSLTPFLKSNADWYLKLIPIVEANVLKLEDPKRPLSYTSSLLKETDSLIGCFVDGVDSKVAFAIHHGKFGYLKIPNSLEELHSGIKKLKETISHLQLLILESAEKIEPPTPEVSHIESHFKKAFDFLQKKDFSSSIHQSISAVESLYKELMCDPSAELSKVSQSIASKLNLHQSITGSIKNLYGFSSDEGGVRHALKPGVEPKDLEAEAIFFYETCQSFIKLCRKKEEKKKK